MKRRHIQTYMQSVYNSMHHKLLRKHKKHWIAISISLMLSLGLGALVNQSAYASTNDTNAQDNGTPTASGSSSTIPSQASIASNINSVNNNQSGSEFSYQSNSVSNSLNTTNSSSNLQQSESNSNTGSLQDSSTGSSSNYSPETSSAKSANLQQTINSNQTSASNLAQQLKQPDQTTQDILSKAKVIHDDIINQQNLPQGFNSAYQNYMKQYGSLDAKVNQSNGISPYPLTPAKSSKLTSGMQTLNLGNKVQQTKAWNYVHHQLLKDSDGTNINTVYYTCNYNGQNMGSYSDTGIVGEKISDPPIPAGYISENYLIIPPVGQNNSFTVNLRKANSDPSNPSDSTDTDTGTGTGGGGSNSPQTDYDSVTYQFNGNTVGTANISGADETSAQSAIDSNVPNNYTIVSGDNVNFFNSMNFNVQVHPIQVSDTLNYVLTPSDTPANYFGQKGTLGTATTGKSDYGDAVRTWSMPNVPAHYHIVSDLHNANIFYDGGTHDVDIAPDQVTQTINYQLDPSVQNEEYPVSGSMQVTQPYDTYWIDNVKGQPQSDYSGNGYNGDFTDIPDHFHISPNQSQITINNNSTQVAITGDTTTVNLIPDTIAQNIQYMQNSGADSGEPNNYVGPFGQIGRTYTVYGEYGTPINNGTYSLGSNSTLSASDTILKYYDVIGTPSLDFDITHSAGDNTNTDSYANNADEGEQNVAITPKIVNMTLHYQMTGNNIPSNYDWDASTFKQDSNSNASDAGTNTNIASYTSSGYYDTQFQDNNNGNPSDMSNPANATDYNNDLNGNFSNVPHHYHVVSNPYIVFNPDNPTYQNQASDTNNANHSPKLATNNSQPDKINVQITPDMIKEDIQYMINFYKKNLKNTYIGSLGKNYVMNTAPRTIYGQYLTRIDNSSEFVPNQNGFPQYYHEMGVPDGVDEPLHHLENKLILVLHPMINMVIKQITSLLKIMRSTSMTKVNITFRSFLI